MKKFLKVLLIVAISLTLGAYLHKCQTPIGDSTSRGCEVDTITYIDTIPFYVPVPTSTALLGYKFITIPRFSTLSTTEADTLPRIRADTEVGEIFIEATDADMDSINLKLPVVQNVYEDSCCENGEPVATYKAYVSGVCPRLDSIFVYPRREVVTIKKPPKRWHIGPTIGYGITPNGLQPYAGISITYSILSW